MREAEIGEMPKAQNRSEGGKCEAYAEIESISYKKSHNGFQTITLIHLHC